jgi:very-short-patch-repair endonuclease
MNRYWTKYNWNNKIYARDNRKNPTRTESLVWHMILKNKKIWVKFLRQRMVGWYIVDFYCSKLKLIIEIDWESHNYKIDYDKKRIKYLKSLWFKVLFYTDEQVLNNLEWVCEDIKYIIWVLKKQTPPPQAVPLPLQGRYLNTEIQSPWKVENPRLVGREGPPAALRDGKGV